MNALTTPALMQSDPLSIAVADRDRNVIGMVADAIATRSVELAYQPVVVSGRSKRLAFFEGLARILDPTGRAIPAKDFIGQVEATELGRQIDCVALECGLKALARNPTMRLSINMSARTIGYSPWLKILDAGIGRAPEIGERLILEITESSILAAPETVAAFMDELQAIGVCFAVDDFGAGFTSLRHLRDLDFDILKIDGHFVGNVHNDPDNQALIRAMLAVSEHFGMLSVAENVEQAEDAAWLSQNGIDCLQGYYFGAPTLTPDLSDSGNLGALA